MDPKYVKYAVILARRIAPEYLADEAEAAALVGLAESWARYDPGLGTKFTTFAHRRIVGAVRDCLRMWEAHGYRRRPGRPAPVVRSLAESERIDPRGPFIELGQTIPSGDLPVGWEAESEDEVLSLTRGLQLRARDAVRLHHLHADAALLSGVARRMELAPSQAGRHVTSGLLELKARHRAG